MLDDVIFEERDSFRRSAELDQHLTEILHRHGSQFLHACGRRDCPRFVGKLVECSAAPQAETLGQQLVSISSTGSACGFAQFDETRRIEFVCIDNQAVPAGGRLDPSAQ